ncbi:hypothetical protein DFH08DRAFT_923415 [Mycena albidolilacea]|uniref:Glutathione S-transferase UstS-like C-terminal domain-containing protein n=1 Tax=Mycena albidolilacea TaxID=1033008 RepID=A0AAD7A7D7_9AGAR|nr:hypothetical protein DFH08DRAFT_923415 [Mycena albidolilacea]
MPDIHATRTALRCPASRKFPDGSDYHMLPMLQDTTPGAEFILGDSLDIAGYLASPRATGLDYSSPHIHDAAGIAPLSTREATAPDPADYAHFNTRVDATFSAYVGLIAHLRDDLIGAFADAERRAGIFRAFDTGIAGLAIAKLYAQKERPFLEGQTPSYADLVVGGWLRNVSQLLEQQEWAEFCTWHGGVFGRMHEILRRQYWEVR